jgi:hypothetical protein
MRNADKSEREREREKEREGERAILVSPRGEKKGFPFPSVMMAPFKITCVVNGVSS